MNNRVILFILATILFSINTLHSQVTIGSDIPPERASLLEIKTKNATNGEVSSETGGILFPRVEITTFDDLNVFTGISENLNTAEYQQKHTGLTVYNIGTTGVEAGIYAWDGTRWQKAGTKKEINFFYMPSIQIDLSQAPQPIELYTLYMQQFQNPKVASTGAPTSIPFYANPTDLYYYVTDYDTRIFSTINITNTGQMTYTLINPLPTDVCCGYINIVFVIK